jgi:hypothetical protein
LGGFGLFRFGEALDHFFEDQLGIRGILHRQEGHSLTVEGVGDFAPFGEFFDDLIIFEDCFLVFLFREIAFPEPEVGVFRIFGFGVSL